MSAELYRLVRQPTEQARPCGTGFRSCEKINNLTPRREDAKSREVEVRGLLCALASLHEVFFFWVDFLTPSPARVHGQDLSPEDAFRSQGDGHATRAGDIYGLIALTIFATGC